MTTTHQPVSYTKLATLNRHEWQSMNFFTRLFSRKPQSYETQKEASQSGDVRARLKLAKDKNTQKEILYYLAEQDPDERVRLAVTRNAAMPPQVSPILALDPSQDVRLVLAQRLVDLLPDVSCDQQSQLYAYVVQALGTLALDEVLKIRKALSSTLKDHAFTPPKIAGQLARDVEREVSEPILRFCAALSDDDLLNILKAHPESWVVQAIAQRTEIREAVSDQVIHTHDRPAGIQLLSNEGADIAPGTLAYIVEKSHDFPEWQKPIATRQGVPMSILKALAEFVDTSVRDLLLLRDDFDRETAAEITEIFRRRIDLVSESDTELSAQQRLKRAIDDGTLEEDMIYDAVSMRDHDFAFAALSFLSKIPVERIEAVFDSRSAKSIVALTWKAGLSMRLALHLQKEGAQIRHKDLIYPSGGTDYPFDEDTLKRQLDLVML